MKTRIYLLPFIVTGLVICYSLYVISSTEIIWGYKQYLGSSLFALSVLLLMINRKSGLFTMAGILVLGLFNILAFTSVVENYAFGFSIGSVGVDIRLQPVSFYLLILFVVCNFPFIRSWFIKPGSAKGNTNRS